MMLTANERKQLKTLGVAPSTMTGWKTHQSKQGEVIVTLLRKCNKMEQETLELQQVVRILAKQI